MDRWCLGEAVPAAIRRTGAGLAMGTQQTPAGTENGST